MGYIRYLNPTDRNPAKITKDNFAKKFDFKGPKFPVKIIYIHIY